MVKKALSWTYILSVLLFMYAPILLIMMFSFLTSSVVGVITPNDTLTFQLYVRLFASEKIMAALGNTILLALVSSVISTTLGTLGAIGVFSSSKRSKNVLEAITQLPVINAEIVMALSLGVLFLFFRVPSTFWTLVIGHVVLTVSFVYLSVKPKLIQMDPSTFEAALDLGATPTKALWLVVFPEILPGILAGFLLSFTLSLDDFLITAFLKPGSGFETLSTLVETQLRIRIDPEFRALTTLIFLFAIVVLIVNYTMSMRQHKKRRFASHS